MLSYPIFPLTIGRVLFILVMRSTGLAVAEPLAFFSLAGAVNVYHIYNYITPFVLAVIQVLFPSCRDISRAKHISNPLGYIENLKRDLYRGVLCAA